MLFSKLTRNLKAYVSCTLGAEAIIIKVINYLGLPSSVPTYTVPGSNSIFLPLASSNSTSSANKLRSGFSNNLNTLLNKKVYKRYSVVFSDRNLVKGEKENDLRN